MIRSITSLVFAISVLFSYPLHADDAKDAKDAFANGRAFFMQGKYQEALGELQRAYSIKPHPSLLRYMGDTYYKLNKAHQAIEQYKKYLQEAPEAADKEKVQNKVRQLEMIVGASEEEEDEGAKQPAISTSPTPQAATEPPPPPTTRFDAPTGEDREDPIALQQREAALAAAKPLQEQEKPSNTFAVLKWVSLGVGLAMLGTGIGLNRAAASDADKLVELAKTDCPIDPATKLPTQCGGNPDLNSPKVTYSKEHNDLNQGYQSKNTIGLIMMIGGGVVTATSVLFFLLDTKKEQRRAGYQKNLTMAPMLGSDSWGVSAAVDF